MKCFLCNTPTFVSMLQSNYFKQCINSLIFLPLTSSILSFFMLEECFIFIRFIITNTCKFNEQSHNFLHIPSHKTAEFLSQSPFDSIFWVKYFERLNSVNPSTVSVQTPTLSVPQRLSLKACLTSETEGDFSMPRQSI